VLKVFSIVRVRIFLRTKRFCLFCPLLESITDVCLMDLPVTSMSVRAQTLSEEFANATVRATALLIISVAAVLT
jgi:hypothetical protein